MSARRRHSRRLPYATWQQMRSTSTLALNFFSTQLRADLKGKDVPCRARDPRGSGRLGTSLASLRQRRRTRTRRDITSTSNHRCRCPGADFNRLKRREPDHRRLSRKARSRMRSQKPGLSPRQDRTIDWGYAWSSGGETAPIHGAALLEPDERVSCRPSSGFMFRPCERGKPCAAAAPAAALVRVELARPILCAWYRPGAVLRRRVLTPTWRRSSGKCSGIRSAAAPSRAASTNPCGHGRSMVFERFCALAVARTTPPRRQEREVARRRLSVDVPSVGDGRPAGKGGGSQVSSAAAAPWLSISRSLGRLFLAKSSVASRRFARRALLRRRRPATRVPHRRSCRRATCGCS